MKLVILAITFVILLSVTLSLLQRYTILIYETGYVTQTVCEETVACIGWRCGVCTYHPMEKTGLKIPIYIAG